jgi:MFS family permease
MGASPPAAPARFFVLGIYA